MKYPELKIIYDSIRSFHQVFEHKCCLSLHKWIKIVKEYGIGELNSCVRGVERDILSVENAVKYEYSNGLAEGSVNKLKVIKRIMYGRCNFDTMRNKILKLESFRKSVSQVNIS